MADVGTRSAAAASSPAAGIVLMLHFGLFHLLAVFWRGRGVCVEPIMNRPLQAKSLAEFWGERWNRAFNELMFRFVFRAAVPWAAAGQVTIANGGDIARQLGYLPADALTAEPVQ